MNKKPTYLRWLLAMTMMIFLWSGNYQANAQCIATSSYGSATLTGENPVTISTCNFPGEYSTLTVNASAIGIPYNFTGTGGSGNYFTLTNSSNIPIVWGQSPLNYTFTADGTYRLHIHTNTACGTESVCHVTMATPVPADAGLEILNPVLAMGYRPINAWMEPARFEIVNNPGAGAVSINAVDIDNNYGNFIDVVSPVLPYTLASGATTTAFGLTANVENAATAGTFNGQCAVIFGSSRALVTATYEGTAYVPIVGDVVETAITLDPSPSPAPAALPANNTREYLGRYKNYILPNDIGNSPNEYDEVYKLTPTVDMLLNLEIYSGTANLALYAEDFEGEGGPMAHNAIVQNIDNLVDIELSANNVYYLVLSALDAALGNYTLEPMPAPDAVTYIAPLDGALNITNGTLLSWTFGNNTSEYELVLGTTYPPTTIVVPYTSDLATSYTLTGLQPNMQYFWRVNVKNTQGTTEGPVWGFTTTIDGITGLTAVVVDPAPTAATVTVNLDWTGPSDRGFLGYNVYRDGTQLNTTPIATSAYTDLAVARNATYTYRVSTVFDEGESALSAPVSVTTLGVGIVNGVVYDILNGPLQGAIVRLQGTNGVFSFTTNASGIYAGQVYAGMYNYTVSATDFTNQTLAGQTVAHNGTLTNDFYLSESPYPVADVVAFELGSDKVQVSWGGSTPPPPPPLVQEWLGYDNDGVPTQYWWAGAGTPFTWAINFEPADLAGLAGTSLTKLAIFGTEASDVNTLNIYQGDLTAGTATLIHTQALTGITLEAWNEIDLTVPVPLDITKQLWVAVHSPSPTGGVAASTPILNLKGDWVNFTGTWQHMSTGLGYNVTWSLRAFATNASNRSVTQLVHKYSEPRYSDVGNNALSSTRIEGAKAFRPVNSNRAIVDYTVWREKVYQPLSLIELGNTSQSDFVDFDWGTMNWGVYRWAVTTNYDGGQTSIPTFSNVLDKNMNVEVDVTVALNSGESAFGTEVTFTNISEPDLELVYTETMSSSGVFTWNAFRRGMYDIMVFKAGYTPLSLSNVEIYDDASFDWLLDEILAPPADLYVTPTGFATWTGGVGTPFEPFMENFDATPVASIPEGWSKSPVTNNWNAHNGTQAGGTANQMRFYWSPSGTQDFYLKTPVMSTTGQLSLQLSFKHYIDDFNGDYTLRVVSIADGVEHIINEWLTPASLPSTTEVYNLTSAHGVGAAEFQIAWVYSGNSFNINNWYLDDVAVMGNRGASRSFQAYKVFHDGVVVADVNQAQYQYGTNGEELVDGETYLAEVATVYSTGQSARAPYTWTYNACDNYATPGNFSAEQVEGTLNVDLSWTIPTIPTAEDQIDFARITRNGEVIIETELANYLDSDLDLGTYTYCITFVYESGAETCPETLCETVVVIGGGFVNGNVKEAAYLGGANIAGATVTLTNTTTSSITFTFTTNASGNYTGEVLAGTYNYLVEADGYVSQTLANVTIAQTATVTHDFVMLEFPYAVGDIVATEITDNAVEIDWSGNGGGGGPGGNTAEWLYYDDGNNVDGIGGPATFTWAIKFDPAQLTDYAGTSLTKISIYNRLSSPMILRIAEGTNAATQVLEQTISGLPIEAWSEVTLTTPVLLDVTKQLWITVYSSDGANYPAAAGAGQNQPNGDLITLDGTTWDHLADLGLDYTWNLRGFVTDMRTNRTIELVRTENTSVYDSNPVNTTFAVSGQKNTSANANINNATRELQGFNVYRTTCETGDLQFLGYTLDSLFTDNTWGTIAPGVYKWGVEAVYDENNSEVNFSNCLDKDMVTVVSVTVITNSGDSPDRTDVTLTNISEPGMNLVYEVRLDDAGYFVWEDFRKGTYDVTVEKNGFTPIMETVEIDGPTNLSYVLEEMMNAVSDLHVSPTGYATWRDGGVQPFDAISFDFEADAQGWEIQGNVNGWQWGNNASLSSTFMNFNGNATNFIAVNADAAGSGGSPIVAMAKSPVMNLENAEQIYLSFDYTLRSDAISVHYSLDGGAPVQIENLAASSGSWTNHVVMLPEEAIAENVQIIFLYTEASTWSYGGGVDNVTLTEEEPADALDYYKVWLDGIFIADTPNTFYQYDVATLTPGQEYFSEVAAVYSNGISEKMNYTWTFYACDSFPGPEDLAYEIVDLNNVVLTWGGGGTPPPPPTGDGIDEDFEGGSMPEGWSVIKTNTSSATGPTPSFWTVNNYISTDFSPFGTYHAGMWWDYSHQDEWLITPEFTCDAGAVMNFWAVVYEGSTYGDHYHVKISTNGGSTWTSIWDASTLSGNGWNYYNSPYNISLAAYAGQDIKLAFNAVDGDGQGLWWVFFVDNVTVGSPDRTIAFSPESMIRMSNATGNNGQIARDGNTSAIERISACVAEKATPNANAKAITGIGKSLAENRAVLFNNGPMVNSAGTGAGGADESILQLGLGMTSYGFGVNNVSGQHLADDFVVDAEWTVESMEFFAYQTGSTTTSSLTGVYFQILNGAPNAGGTVIFGDLTTNRMSSTSWTNIYRNDDGPGGSTNRPIMKAVANVTGLTLQPGTYWVEYTLTGSLTSGPWTPPVTINGQTNTGNAMQFASGAWNNLVDGTFPQGIPLIINGTAGGGGGTGGSTTFDPGEFLGANVYRNGELIAEMVQAETYTDSEVEPGNYEYCVVFVYEENAMSCMTTCVDVLVTEDCAAPQNLTATVGDANEVTLVWNEQTATEFRYDDGTSTGQLGFSGGTITSILGAKHNTSAVISELSWFTTAEGGPHTSVQVYVFGLTSAGMPNGSNVLYTASVTNTDNTWNTHTLPTPVTANGGFYIALGYNGFAGIGTDDGVGAPYVYQNGTHYYSGDYTTNEWSSFEGSGFPNNAMIRAIGMAGAKASYTIAPEMTPVDAKTQMSVIYTTNAPVATGTPQWSVPARSMNRAFLGYNIYKNGSLFEALWPETTYVYQEGVGGQTCYTVTAEYEFCGESDPSNEACVTLVDVKTTDLSQIKVYPNPTNSLVNIVLTNNVSQVVIYNYLGQVVYENNVTDQTTLTVDVRNYEAGAYLVKFITSQGQSITKKVVVTK